MSLQAAFKQAMYRFKDAGHEARDILAMGLCIIRCCRVLLKADGSLAHPVISWMDKRLNTPYDHDPRYGEVAYLTTSSGYITQRLTGEFKDTCANYIGWWPMDDEALDWSTDPAQYELNNVPREMLFEVVKPGQVLGRVTPRAAELTGAPQGLPVVATAHDKAVEALGAGALEPGTGLVSLGTYIGALTQGRGHHKNAKHYWSFQASIPGRYLYECMGVRRGMWTVSWFCNQFGDGVVEQAKSRGLTVEDMFNQEAAQVPPGCEGLITIHDWAPPPEAEYRKGVMLGFDGRHTRAHMYRSILEGIAFTLKLSMDPMFAELGAPLRNLVVSGGGANSDVFMQIFADVFGVPARRNRMRGSAAVGCAINAGMAVGAFASYEEAIAHMVRVADEFQPDPANTEFYDSLCQRVYAKVHMIIWTRFWRS